MENWFPALLLKYPFLPVYLFAVLVALWRYPRYFDTQMRYFPVLLMYTLATEILGVLTIEYNEISLFVNDLFRNYNWLIYNIYLILFTLYFMHVYYQVIHKTSHRRMILLAAGSFLFVCALNLLFQSFRYEMQLAAYLAGSVVLVLASVLYLIHRRARSGRWFSDRDLLSWVSLGLAVFYSGFIPVTLIRNYNSLYQIADPAVVRIVLQGLIIAMYGCIIVGFLRMRNLRVYLNQ